MDINEQEWRLNLGVDDNMEIVIWPDSQEYMEMPWFENEATLINDGVGVELFGGSAYLIPKVRLGVTQNINKAIFDTQTDECIQTMKDVVNQTMANNGDKCSCSQHMCILQAINELEHNISGVELKDFKDK